MVGLDNIQINNFLDQEEILGTMTRCYPRIEAIKGVELHVFSVINKGIGLLSAPVRIRSPATHSSKRNGAAYVNLEPIMKNFVEGRKRQQNDLFMKMKIQKITLSVLLSQK